ncbi:MAG: DUF89 family protein [Elusimicrobia bacterium]|nr:DUF89 family protein [Elusimicrobiota bacterium]
MKTYLECIPCFFKQGIESAKILGATKDQQKQIVDEIAKTIPCFPLDSSPPEMGKIVHDIIKKVLKADDPYKQLKQESNQIALSIYKKLKQKVINSEDKLLTGLHLSIAGNIIDYGANHNVHPEREVLKILDSKNTILNKRHFHYLAFKKRLEKADLILFIGDNAGEIVFDKILAEEIKNLYPAKKLVYAVRETPIINDITTEDALFVGMDETAQIISSGSDIPGTLLSRCNDEFLSLFHRADIIISKGQGNFETLADKNLSVPLFFLLTVKCPVVGDKLNAKIGDFILKPL